jgi:mRNA-degrading endonuclease RelE of RelBE toxin-antitoxin system
LKFLVTSHHFKRQLKKLPSAGQDKVIEALKNLRVHLEKGKIPAGLGFKKINGDKYEIRADIHLRIAMKLEKDTLVCHVVGNHDEIRKYLKEYRNR